MLSTDTPTVREYELRTGTDLIKIRGRKIGSGTSETTTKLRWFEVDIYELEDGGFAVHTRGKSRIPGETVRARLRQTGTAVAAIQILIVDHNGKVYLPNASIDAIEGAIIHNEEMKVAYNALPESLLT